MNYVKVNRNTLAAFNRSRVRYLHISVPIKWVTNPRSYIDGIPRPDVPIAVKLGRKDGRPLATYNTGRNEAKRIRKAASL